LALGIYRCRACRSGGEGHGRSGGEGRGGSTRSRRPQRARGVVKREKEGLLRSVAAEMSPSGVKAQWRGRHGGECGRRGGAAERRHSLAEIYRGAVAR
jgi:hypothetical protein